MTHHSPTNGKKPVTKKRVIIVFVAILIFTLLTSWIWAWPSKSATPAEMPASISQGVTTADLSSSQGMTVTLVKTPGGDQPCKKVIAFVGVVTDPTCGNKLPDPVRKVVGSTLTGCFLGWLYGPAMPAGCVAGFIGSIGW